MWASDCEIISRAFAAQGWDKPVAQFTNYLDEKRVGVREVLIAEWDGDFAGYVTIVWQSHYTFFRERGIPEIVDLNVLMRYRRHGVASALVQEAETRIAKRNNVAGLGVGLTTDYGAAQTLYVRRGYIPDGRGMSQRGKLLTFGEVIVVDDDLVLYFTKELRR
jgi:ribosomal protein S18 acetylase RimI-like enzyme